MSDLREKLQDLLLRKKNLAIQKIAKTQNPMDRSELPIDLSLIRLLAVTEANSINIANINELIGLISEVAIINGLTVYNPERFSWDISKEMREKYVKKPPVQTNIDTPYQPPKYISGHIPRAQKGGKHPNSDMMWDDPNNSIDD